MARASEALNCYVFYNCNGEQAMLTKNCTFVMHNPQKRITLRGLWKVLILLVAITFRGLNDFALGGLDAGAGRPS